MRLQLTVAVAAACVLAVAPARAQGGAAQPAGGPVGKVSLETSGYTDSDHVSVISPTISGTVADDVAGWSVTARYLVDVVSAASVDIVSTASSKWTETRHVGSGAASYQRGPVGMTLSGGVSREPDYLSISGGGKLTLDLLDKNVTPYVGLSYGHNDVGRTGLSTEHWRLMQSVDLQIGATFVVDRATIASVGFDADFEWGYLAKPYRSIAIFGPGVNVPVGASIDLVNALRSDVHPAEQLPTQRRRYAVTGRIARRFDGVTVRVDERVYRDSWGLWASTTDGRVMFDVGERLVLWPHLRFHGQTAADFWQRAYRFVPLADGTPGLPLYRTGDRELSWLHTVTAGGGARLRLTSGTSAPWYLGLEADLAITRYTDALFLTERRSFFSALTLDTEWD